METPLEGEQLRIKVDHDAVTPDQSAGDWNDAATWGPDDARVPTTSDPVWLDQPQETVINLPSGQTGQAYSLIVGSSRESAPTAVLNLEGELTLSKSAQILESGKLTGLGGEMTITSGALTNRGVIESSLTSIVAPLSNTASGTLNLSGGTLTGPLTNAGNGDLTNIQASLIANSGTLSLSGGSAQNVANLGSLSLLGSIDAENIDNGETGLLTLNQTVLTLQQAINNSGTLTATQTQIIQMQHNLAMEIIRNLGSEIIGVLNVEGSLFSGTSGLINPGNPIGEIVVQGNYTDHGVLRIELAGTQPLFQYDRISVGMDAILDGAIQIEYAMDPNAIGEQMLFQPDLGQVFDIIIAKNLEISEATLDLPQLPPHLIWKTSVVPAPEENQAFRLEVIDQPRSHWELN
jgi:hypothetical protein